MGAEVLELNVCGIGPVGKGNISDRVVSKVLKRFAARSSWKPSSLEFE